MVIERTNNSITVHVEGDVISLPFCEEGLSVEAVCAVVAQTGMSMRDVERMYYFWNGTDTRE